MSDGYYDPDIQLERALSPSRGGILSDLALHRIALRVRKDTADIHDTRRLLADTKAVRWRLHTAIVDLCGSRQSWLANATEVRRLQDRITQIVSYLTDEQRERLFADDTARREGTA